MASIVVRNLSDDVLLRLKRQASAHKRSVESEVRRLIEASVDWSEQAAAFQAELAGRNLPPSLELLREERDR